MPKQEEEAQNAPPRSIFHALLDFCVRHCVIINIFLVYVFVSVFRIMLSIVFYLGIFTQVSHRVFIIVFPETLYMLIELLTNMSPNYILII